MEPEAIGKTGWLRTIVREPTVHFIVLGGALFLASQLLNPQSDEPVREISIGQGEASHLETLWVSQRGRKPTAAEFAGIVQDYVETELFYREAMILGLDKDDTIVKRRLAQKLEFVSRELTAPAEPSDAQLQTWLSEHAAAYASAPTVTFEQVFYKDVASEIAGADVTRDLAALSANAPPASLGGALPFSVKTDDVTEMDLGTALGADFARQVFAAETGVWIGPIRSPFGLHLVRVQQHNPARPAILADIRPRVLSDWQDAQALVAHAQLVEALKAKYDLRIAPEVQARLDEAKSLR